ncbi:uncharacterized protein LOC117599020, partial [Tachysurus ichikawai]
MSQAEVRDAPGIIMRTQESSHNKQETRTSATTIAISKSMEAAGDGHAFPVFPENSSFSMRPRQINEHWSNPTEQLQVWTPTHHVCYRPLTVYHIHLQNFSINSLAECKSRNKASSPPGMVRSITSMDLSVSD